MPDFLPWDEESDWIVTPDDGMTDAERADEHFQLCVPDPTRVAPLDTTHIPKIDPRHVIIDWISASWPVQREDWVHGDVAEVWQNDQRLVSLKIRSAWRDHPSWSSKVQLRVVGGFCQISGNLNKWLHGHALHGISDPSELIRAWCRDQFIPLGFNIEPSDNQQIKITRIDLTGHYDCKTVDRANYLLSALRYVLRARLPGEVMPGSVHEYRNTVYWGQHSKAWTLKVYNKYRELVRRYKKGLETLNYWEVPESVLRWELTLRGNELMHTWSNLRSVPARNFELHGWSQWAWNRTMKCAGNWTAEKGLGMFTKYLTERIQAYDNSALPPENMTGKQLLIFRGWQAGDPLHTYYGERQWYRIRKEFKESYSIDLQRPFNPDSTGNQVNIVSQALSDLRAGRLYAFRLKEYQQGVA